MLMTNSSGNLDVLRSLAVLFVLLSHLPFVPVVADPSINANALGHWGVFIFFVHTCYVLMGALDRQASKDTGIRFASKFWLMRVVRIYPLSMVVVLVVSIDALVLGVGVSQRAFWSNLLLIQNLTGEASMPGPLWSLPFELQMYLALPFLFFLTKKKNANSVLIVFGIWAVTVISSIYFMQSGKTYSSLKFAPFFLSGVLAYTLVKMKPFLSPYWMVGLVLITAASYPYFSTNYPVLHFFVWPLCLALGVLIAFSREIRSIWILYIAKYVARYSFGIYLFHVPCIDWVFGRWEIESPVMQWMAFLALVISLPVISYHCIEKPLLEKGRRWIDKM